jgi:PAS domain S-box-containing protein
MPPSPGSPDPRASPLWDEGTVRTEHAGRVRELRAPGPGVMSALPGMAYLCRFDDDWTMDFVSAGAEELTGHPAEAFLAGGSVSYADVIHPEDRQRVTDEVGRAVECDRSFRLEYRIRTADGRERWVLEVGHPVRDLQGELLAIEGFVQDLTERRDLELQLRHAQKMEAVGRVAGGLAHDFNNLLTVIGSNAQFLLEDLTELDVAENVREEAREVARAAKVGADLTAQLLAFARKQPHSPRIQSVNCLVQECQGMMARLLGPEVTLSLRLDPELPAARLDRGQMEQVLMNLAANARDAMPGGGTVTVETTSLDLDEPYTTKRVSLERGAWVLLALSDDGDGMTPELLERVFEPFFTTKEEGTGLGLATVFGIVRQHQGHVSVSSEPGSGTTFEIYLPAADAAEDEAGPRDRG